MMSVKLEQVTEATFIPCAKLEVDEGQKKFVASNLFTNGSASNLLEKSWKEKALWITTYEHMQKQLTG